MEIMELLAEGPMSTSGAAEKLNIPLTTAQYNIEKLMEAGLVKIAKTKYSEKGREVKLYEAMNRAIIILPGKTGAGPVMEALKRYIIVLPIVAAASVLVEYLVPFTQSSYSPALDESAKGGTYLMNSAASPTASAVPQVAYQPPVPSAEAVRGVWDQASQSVTPIVQHTGLWFFAGCLLAILLLVILEYARYNKPKSNFLPALAFHAHRRQEPAGHGLFGKLHQDGPVLDAAEHAQRYLRRGGLLVAAGRADLAEGLLDHVADVYADVLAPRGNKYTVLGDAEHEHRGDAL